MGSTNAVVNLPPISESKPHNTFELLELDPRVVDGEMTLEEVKAANRLAGAKEDNLTVGKLVASKPTVLVNTVNLQNVSNNIAVNTVKQYNRWYRRLWRGIKSWVK